MKKYLWTGDTYQPNRDVLDRIRKRAEEFINGLFDDLDEYDYFHIESAVSGTIRLEAARRMAMKRFGRRREKENSGR